MICAAAQMASARQCASISSNIDVHAENAASATSFSGSTRKRAISVAPRAPRSSNLAIRSSFRSMGDNLSSATASCRIGRLSDGCFADTPERGECTRDGLRILVACPVVRGLGEETAGWPIPGFPANCGPAVSASAPPTTHNTKVIINLLILFSFLSSHFDYGSVTVNSKTAGVRPSEETPR